MTLEQSLLVPLEDVARIASIAGNEGGEQERDVGERERERNELEGQGKREKRAERERERESKGCRSGGEKEEGQERFNFGDERENNFVRLRY